MYPLDDQARERYVDLYRHQSTQGFRVLAVIEVQQAYHVSDEQHLILAGLATFADPPLPDAAESIRALARDGVQVKVLTGGQ